MAHGTISMTPAEATKALERLARQIEELRVDLNLEVEVLVDESDRLQLTFSGSPGDGITVSVHVHGIPGAVVRRAWNEHLRGDMD